MRPDRTDCRHGRADFWPNRVRPDKANFRSDRADFKQTDRQMDEQTDGRTDERTDERTNKQKSPVFYRTLSPSLPCFLLLQFTIMLSRARGIADHTLPLGDLIIPITLFLVFKDQLNFF